jgi:cupin 2 domain-containing protein
MSTPLRRGNLFATSPEPSEGEVFDTLLNGRSFRLERIVSHGDATPAGEWYDQDADEWVALLSGSATLTFESPREVIELVAGDWVLIPAHRRHRVERTEAGVASVWLALHFVER